MRRVDGASRRGFVDSIHIMNEPGSDPPRAWCCPSCGRENPLFVLSVPGLALALTFGYLFGMSMSLERFDRGI